MLSWKRLIFIGVFALFLLLASQVVQLYVEGLQGLSLIFGGHSCFLTGFPLARCVSETDVLGVVFTSMLNWLIWFLLVSVVYVFYKKLVGKS